MVTKLRKFSTSRYAMLYMFLFAVLSITAAAVLFHLARLKVADFECLFVKDYSNSKAFILEAEDVLDKVLDLRYNDRVYPDDSFYYYLNDGKKEYTDSEYHEEKYFTDAGIAYFKLNAGVWTYNVSGKEIAEISVNYYISKYITGYVAFTEEFMSKRQMEWNSERQQLYSYFIIGSILALLGLLMVVFLIFQSIKNPSGSKLIIKVFDKVYTDVTLFLFILLGYFFINNIFDIYSDNFSVGLKISGGNVYFFTDFKHDFISSLIFFSIIMIAYISALLLLLLASLSKLRERGLIRNSLIFKIIQIIRQIYFYITKYYFYPDEFHELSVTNKLYCRQLIMITSTVILVIWFFITIQVESYVIIIPIILETVVFTWYSKGNDKLLKEIDSNIQYSLQEQMKSERMKVALITNVSHDLKTPLTSIISYVDLLSQEEGLSESAKDYIAILQSKSDRLKNIVTDLFELAKSTSGDIQLDFKVIDLKKLTEQTLSEMEDKIAASGLQMRTKLPDTQVSVKSDGKRLYRVFQNVIDNALKYSMKGTRIYIDVEKTDSKAIATIKNIAGYEMNFTPEEILQRFTRGDLARSEEGSGLGLSIAESFTRVCGGDFKVDIDGDLFKVNITFPLVVEE